jgi:hypothetical protein
MAKTLTRKSDGRFVRDLGFKPEGGQHRFYLGRDETLATIRNAQLQALWNYWRGIREGMDACGPGPH